MTDEAIREMRSVEDHHWWYAVLRQQVALALRSRLNRGARILDAGCGTGGMYAKLAREWDCYGLDASICAIQFCKERGWHKAQLGDIHALPYESRTFSAVLSLDVLYHSAVVDDVH
jgi:2-polyprenyl-3-methyl-5-hydroxy-6-metoxy-1,4-benzoquinol methylase